MAKNSIIEDEETNTIECVNISSETMRFEIDKVKYKLGPKEKVQLHKSYAMPRAMQQGRDPVPSAIELLTGSKVLPITDRRARAALGISDRASRREEVTE